MVAENVELTLWRTIKVFWSYAWRAWLLGFGFWIFSLAYAWIGKSLVGDEPTNAGAIYIAFGALVYLAGFAGYVFGHLLVFRIALGRQWSDFKLLPVSKTSEVVELTLLRALKVYWSFAWRTSLSVLGFSVGLILIGLIASLVLGAPLGSKESWSTTAMVFVLLLIPLMIWVQFLIWRIALRVKWSDFELLPVARN